MYLFHVFQSRQTASRWRKESDDPTCYPRRNVSTPTRSISIAKLFKKTKEEFEKDEKEFSAARDLMHICLLPPPFHLKSLHKKCHQISLGIQATLYLRTVNRIGLISYFPKKPFLSLPDFQRWIKSFCVRSSRLDCSCKGPKGQIYFPKDLTLCAVESRGVWFFFYKDGAYFLPNQYESLALSFFFHEPTQSLRKLLCSISAEYQSSSEKRRTQQEAPESQNKRDVWLSTIINFVLS